MPERSEATDGTRVTKAPTRRAVVMVEPGSSELNVAALTVFDRLLVALHRAGFTSITVVGAGPLPRAPRARAWGVAFGEAISIPPLEGPTLFVRGNVLVQAGDLGRLAAEGGRLVGPSGESYPVGVVSGSVPHWDVEMEALPRVKAEGVAAWVRNEAEAGVAGRRLWASIQSSSDGWVDRVFNRRVGRPLARVLSRTPVTPNQISVVSILVGVVSAAMFAVGKHPWSVAGALVFQLSAILDCVDGDVARIVFKESALGKWLDLVGDQVVHLGVFGGIAIGLARAGMDAPIGWLAASAIVGALLSFVMVLRGMRMAAGTGSVRGLGRWLDAATNRDFSVVVFGLACVDGLLLFLWVAAIGSHVFWLLLWGLQRRGHDRSRGAP